VRGTPLVLVAVAAVVVLQALFTYTPLMHTLFHTEALSPAWGVGISACGVAVLVILELEKALLRRLGHLA
jgi:tellurite resistance protein TehA-like permease